MKIYLNNRGLPDACFLSGSGRFLGHSKHLQISQEPLSTIFRRLRSILLKLVILSMNEHVYDVKLEQDCQECQDHDVMMGGSHSHSGETDICVSSYAFVFYRWTNKKTLGRWRT